MKIELREELRKLDKTNKEAIYAFTEKGLALIAFDMHQNYGFPLEMTIEELKSKDLNNLEKLLTVINYIKE